MSLGLGKAISGFNTIFNSVLNYIKVMKVWIVHTDFGEFYDPIDEVFDSEEKAEAYVKNNKYINPRYIDEFEVK